VWVPPELAPLELELPPHADSASAAPTAIAPKRMYRLILDHLSVLP
jgi:hypothetical protein